MNDTDPHRLYRQFKVQQVRDLAFLLCSESPLASSALRPLKTLSALEVSEVLALCRAMEERPLASWLRLPEVEFFPLGRYAEYLSDVWLAQSQHYRIIAQHEQIRDGSQTLGEIDYLLESGTGLKLGREHWEASINFFCMDANPPYLGLGPNMKDTLDEKCRRVFDQQLKLSSQYVFAERYGVGWQAKALFQGWLFRPISIVHAWPQWANPKANLGYWTRSLDELNELAKRFDPCHWGVLEKQRWIAPSHLQGVDSSPSIPATPLQALNAYMPTGKDAPLLVGYGQDGWEKVRCFYLGAGVP